MSTPAGHIELERAVDSIMVGRRHRADLGDLDALAASIRREGLLQPPTITPDGVLVCGRRRLAAIKQLRWRTVNVWVRSGISDRLGQLMAEQDDNMLHKPLTQLEAAGLYRELKQVMAEDAARRKEATWFGPAHQPGSDGPAKLAGPSLGPLGTAREQAARLVTGRASYTTLEKIGFLQQIADDPTQPDQLRQHVTEELARIEAGAPVHPIYEAVRDTIQTVTEQTTESDAESDVDLDALARQALARAKDATATKRRARRRPTPPPAGKEGGVVVRYPVRAFVTTWGELVEWWLHYDIAELATALTDEQVESFLNTVQGTSTFADHLCAARTTGTDAGSVDVASARGHLRAL